MQKKQGISLIVLVITIIVMIVLAAAVVITLSNTGIINKANQAVKVTDRKQVEQIASLAWAEAYAEGARTKESLQVAVDDALKGVKLSDYVVVVTENGVSVKDKSEYVLAAPVIEVIDNKLAITVNDTKAEKYEVYVDGELKTTLTRPTLNYETKMETIRGTSEAKNDGTYYLSGSWQWNPYEDLVYSGTSGKITQNINYMYSKHEGRTGKNIEITWNNAEYYGSTSFPADKILGVMSKWDADENKYTDGLADISGWWTGYDERLIDFGTEPQQVSADFYNFVVTNAKPTNWYDHYFATGSTWMWKSALNDVLYVSYIGNVIANDVTYVENAAVRSYMDDENYVFLVLMVDASGNVVIPYLNEYGWLDGTYDYENMDETTIISSDKYRIWDFGENTTYLKNNFYIYLTNNAKQVSVAVLTDMSLTTGQHTIEVKACANGYNTSAVSNSLTYTAE